MKADRRQIDATLPENDTFGGAETPFPRWKRAIDLAACLLALPILGLGTLVMWLLTKCFAPGPVLFRQERIGHLGGRFNIYKLRTMTHDAEQMRSQLESSNEMDGPLFKMRADPRATPVGRLSVALVAGP